MSFCSETTVKAVRKRHVCDGCGQHIQIGEPARRWAGMTDGDFGTAVYHIDCREAEIALNKLMDLNADEWCGLIDIEREDWPWLVETYPAIAQRMGIALQSKDPQHD